MTNTYGVSFRCFYNSEGETHYTMHYQPMPLTDVPRWIEAYRFTHPNCTSISAKVWFNSASAESGAAT